MCLVLSCLRFRVSCLLRFVEILMLAFFFLVSILMPAAFEIFEV